MSAARRAQALADQGRLAQARDVLTRGLASAPNDAELCNAMAMVLLRAGERERGLYFLERAARARPGDPLIRVNLSGCLTLMGRHAEAEAAARDAVAAAPQMVEPRLALATACCAGDRYWAAAQELESARRTWPHDPGLTALLIAVLGQIGRAPDAVALGRESLARGDRDLRVARALAIVTNYDPGSSVEQVVAAHREFGAMLPCAPPWSPHPDDPERKLRIGILSHELRRHSVAFFLEPLLANLDRDRMDVVCYTSSNREDDTTRRLKSLAGGWRSVAGADDAAAAGIIRADTIDILIETSGLTQGNRLGLMALRPAPVQATFLGYPATTGLRAIAHRIVDSRTDPAGSEAHCVESLLRLDPVFLCYGPPAEAAAPAPRGPGDPVVFGSFSAVAKLNDQVLSLWSRILSQIPGSRLIVKALGFQEEGLRSWLAERLAHAGIDRASLVAPNEGLLEHLGAYGRIDVALDTFPYNGTTTTCEALWMGVPVVTLEGQMHARRVGVTLLESVGLRDLVARTPDDYVRIAVELAKDKPRLTSLRHSLRPTMAASALCDGPGYARRFEAGLRRAWQDWCRGERTA